MTEILIEWSYYVCTCYSKAQYTEWAINWKVEWIEYHNSQPSLAKLFCIRCIRPNIVKQFGTQPRSISRANSPATERWKIVCPRYTLADEPISDANSARFCATFDCHSYSNQNNLVFCKIFCKIFYNFFTFTFYFSLNKKIVVGVFGLCCHSYCFATSLFGHHFRAAVQRRSSFLVWFSLARRFALLLLSAARNQMFPPRKRLHFMPLWQGNRIRASPGWIGYRNIK